MRRSKRFKVVFNEKSGDRHLVGFFPTLKEALETSSRLGKGYDAFHTEPERIVYPRTSDYSHYICSLIPLDEWKRVMQSDAAAEISADLLACNARTYYELSRRIPADFTVIDIGCGYNAQAYLFDRQQKHIAVNPPMDFDHLHFEQFRPAWTQYYEITGQEFIKDVLPSLDIDKEKTFAICHFVPDEECRRLVRETFENVYVFYPDTPTKELKI